jgi:hypothetical protein
VKPRSFLSFYRPMVSSDSNPQPHQPIAQAVLAPLLDDFQYWFSETATLLQSTQADCLETGAREALAAQVAAAQQEVATTRTLMLATDGHAGVAIEVVGQWHQLVGKCWQTARYVREHYQGDRASD